jgi:predicted Zn-ribbon and HTH transcriptional regulator
MGADIFRDCAMAFRDCGRHLDRVLAGRERCPTCKAEKIADTVASQIELVIK